MKYSIKRFFMYLLFSKFVMISSGGVYADIAPVNIHCPCEIERVNQTKAIVTFYIAFQKEVDESGELKIQIYGSDRITSFYANSLWDLGNRNLDSIQYSPSPVKVRVEVPLVSSQETEIFISLVLSNSAGSIDQVNFIEEPIYYKNLGGSYWQASSRLMFNSSVVFDYDELSYSVYIESITSTDLKSQSDNITGEIIVSNGSTYYEKSSFEYSVNFNESGIGTLDYDGNLDYEINSQFENKPDHKFVYLWLYRDGNLILSYLLKILGEEDFPDINEKWININTINDSDGDRVSDFNERLVGTNPLVSSTGSGAVIEIAFTVGSSAAESDYGGVNLNASIEHHLEVANAAFKDSALNIELKNIGVYLVGEDYELDASEVLDAIQARQGIFSDLETMFTRPPDLIIHYSSLESIEIGGLASVRGSHNDGIIDFKNSYKDGRNGGVVAIDNTSLTLAHEIGHLLGLDHSRRQIANVSIGTFPWSLGYGVDANFSTIMAYASEFEASQIGVFSSPNLICGDPKLRCGVDSDNHLIGADAASSLTVTALQVSAISNGFPPTISLIGYDLINILIGENYTEKGFSAFDKEDGDLTSSVVVSGNVDTTKTGTYKVDYDVSDADNNSVIASRIVNVIADTDGDFISDSDEISSGTNPLLADTDGDGANDNIDIFPLDATESVDTDSDGLGNNADTDDDNDDVLDGDDAFPLDSNESLDTDSDGTGNNADTDDDGDSVLDGDDAFPLDATESVDTDSDGVGNNADADDDGDGLDDVLEKSIGTNPFKRDSDFDSLSDKFEVDSKSRDPLVADYSLATGWNHTCVTSDLGVSCWAEESLGRLIPPNNMGSVSQLSLGQSHSCALTKRDGKIYCWDDNGDQQLTLGSGFSQISAGGYHTCALKNEEIVCFGNNSDGQRDSPTLSNVSKVASGPSHACALANNKISCWGKNHFGQTDVPNLSNPVGLFSGGEGHVSCASHDDGWNCWGDESKVSLPPESLSKSADLAIGRNHMCAVDNNKVECWGDNYRNMSTPPDLSNPVQIELGTFHSCALSDSGVDCWGDSSRTSVPSSLRFGDFDGDSTPDDTDTDDDNDGVVDGDDAFPLDATESVDTDSDGIGNNADTDDDGDGVSDIDDTFPLDATESSDFDGDGVGDNTDLVNTTLTFSDGVFDISVKVNDPNDNPVSFIDLRFGAPSSHTCFINATATEIQSEGVYQANIKWAIGNNYTTQKYGVIDDSPVVHFSDGTKLYDQNQYYLDLTNLNSVAPQYKIESFQTAQTDIENEVEFEIIISGFGEDGFLLKYPTSSSGLLDIQVHFANNSDYVGVGFKQNEVEKIANDRYVMRGKVVISDPEDFMNPKLKLVSMCDASMNGKAWEQDSDQDSMIDVLDAFPQDSSEIYDTDSDGVGNNADTDDDNDSVLDGDDAFPLDATETLDTDGDGIGNNADTDDDNDGAVDSDDAFPLDSAESSDSDGDGLGDNADAFPNDSSETVDSDLDGIGDNADVFPNDPTESTDTDLDGVGDNADAFPNDASETLDSDSDGTGDNADAFPNNALYKADSDLDGMPDAWETRYGLDPNDSSDATSDQDNDGVTALDEFLAGTIPSGSIDLDGNEDYDALTDGLLLLRGMFGLDGSALVTGTIASDATYTESVDIESRIETLGDLADIDGNGDIDALTDGLLTLRYLFGLQGDTLINGVVAEDATRKTAEEIEAHLETLMPSL